MSSPTYTWPEGKGLEHHCAKCLHGLARTEAKTQCVDKHVFVCPCYHSILHLDPTACKCCDGQRERAYKRQKSIAIQVKAIRELDGEIDAGSPLSSKSKHPRKPWAAPHTASGSDTSTSTTSSKGSKKSTGSSTLTADVREVRRALYPAGILVNAFSAKVTPPSLAEMEQPAKQVGTSDADIDKIIHDEKRLKLSRTRKSGGKERRGAMTELSKLIREDLVATNGEARAVHGWRLGYWTWLRPSQMGKVDGRESTDGGDIPSPMTGSSGDEAASLVNRISLGERTGASGTHDFQTPGRRTSTATTESEGVPKRNLKVKKWKTKGRS
ncbi:hypothetical protein MMC25_006271 [Agyrium rufum]|nr:hypothetical protein [Agyrium rufum]